MNLWIRSQSGKDFIQVERVRISTTDLSIIVNDIVYGTYDSEERTMEVLDEIVNMMTVKLNIHAKYEESDLKLKSEILCNMTKIYNMPKR